MAAKFLFCEGVGDAMMAADAQNGRSEALAGGRHE